VVQALEHRLLAAVKGCAPRAPANVPAPQGVHAVLIAAGCDLTLRNVSLLFSRLSLGFVETRA
jgi:hypothetical protein